MDAARVAGPADAEVVAALLDAFNSEFDAPTPGTAVLAGRLRGLLADEALLCLLTGDPAVGLAVLTLRPSVWYDGPVAVLDELYVAPDRRGAGIGTVLLRQAESLVLARGGAVVEINVDGADVDARRFYERHGYTGTDPGRDDEMLYLYRELGGTT